MLRLIFVDFTGQTLFRQRAKVNLYWFRTVMRVGRKLPVSARY